MCVFFLPFIVTIAARRVLSRVRVLYFPLSIVYSYFRFTISPGCDIFFVLFLLLLFFSLSPAGFLGLSSCELPHLFLSPFFLRHVVPCFGMFLCGVVLSLRHPALLRRQLRWLGHVSRMPFDRLPRRLLSSWLPYKRSRGVSEMTFGKTMIKALKTFDIDRKHCWLAMAANRTNWRHSIGIGSINDTYLLRRVYTQYRHVSTAWTLCSHVPHFSLICAMFSLTFFVEPMLQ